MGAPVLRRASLTRMEVARLVCVCGFGTIKVDRVGPMRSRRRRPLTPPANAPCYRAIPRPLNSRVYDVVRSLTRRRQLLGVAVYGA